MFNPYWSSAIHAIGIGNNCFSQKHPENRRLNATDFFFFSWKFLPHKKNCIKQRSDQRCTKNMARRLKNEMQLRVCIRLKLPGKYSRIRKRKCSFWFCCDATRIYSACAVYLCVCLCPFSFARVPFYLSLSFHHIKPVRAVHRWTTRRSSANGNARCNLRSKCINV